MKSLVSRDFTSFKQNSHFSKIYRVKIISTGGEKMSEVIHELLSNLVVA